LNEVVDRRRTRHLLSLLLAPSLDDSGPFDGAVVGVVPRAGIDDADAAVAAAEAGAVDPLSRPGEEQLLEQLGDVVARRCRDGRRALRIEVIGKGDIHAQITENWAPLTVKLDVMSLTAGAVMVTPDALRLIDVVPAFA